MLDIVIIGAGPAGLTAAVYAGRAGLKTLVLDKSVYGGQIAYTSEVDNFPGIEGLSGVELATNLYNHALHQGAEVRFEEVIKLELEGQPKQVITAKESYECKAVIMAGGARRRTLGVPGEERFTGHGVSYCATCDGAFFRGKTVAVVGGGDTAFSDALYLANLCEKVYLIHRRESFRAALAEQNAVHARDNIEVLRSTTVERIEGLDKVESLLVNGPSGSQTLAVNGLFVAIGQEPENSLLHGWMPLNERGYVNIGESCAAHLKGVWVAGDIREKPLRQVVTAAADGAVAAMAASEYCNKLEG